MSPSFLYMLPVKLIMYSISLAIVSMTHARHPSIHLIIVILIHGP